MVGRGLPTPAPTSEPDVTVSRHPAPEYQAVVISTVTIEPYHRCGSANAIAVLDFQEEVLLSLRSSRVPKAFAL